MLRRINDTGGIFWAIADKDWILDGANVHVSLVGFDDGEEKSRVLDGEVVAEIHNDLTSSAKITEALPLRENQELSFIGSAAHGPFDMDESTAHRMLATTGNPNGRPNSDVVRPVISGIDIVQGPRRKWTVDFGTLSEEESANYAAPFEHVRTHVYPVRAKNRRSNYASKWWQYGEVRPGMRKALEGKERFIGTARVAKHRVFVWLSCEVLPNDQVVVFARSDDYSLGILHSRPHEVWALAQGTQLREKESGFRYTPTTCFETYPMPWVPGSELRARDARCVMIAQAARIGPKAGRFATWGLTHTTERLETSHGFTTSTPHGFKWRMRG